MAANVYNIIWADDEIDSFRLDDSVIGMLKLHNINLLDYAHTSSELKLKLEEWEDKVDAVITDGNFDKTKTVDIVRSTSGISDVLNFISDFNRKRIIPFYLYTGKKNLLKEKFTDGELEYFEKRDRIFEKGTLSKMLSRIKEEVDSINSPQFRIRNEYKKEFEAAILVEDAERNLEKGLLYLYEEDSWKDVQDYFNPARKIVERIVAECEKMKILPPKSSLNNASKLFSGMVNDNHERLKEEVMMRPLAESLFHFLKITQDGSHDANDMSLGVDKYVRQTKNINLYRSILYIAMDILLWFKNIHEKYQNNTTPLWEEKYDYEGKVFVDVDIRNKKYFYTSKYELQTLADNDLKYGDIVRIYTSDSSIHPKGNITEYVKKGNYRRL